MTKRMLYTSILCKAYKEQGATFRVYDFRLVYNISTSSNATRFQFQTDFVSDHSFEAGMHSVT